MFRITALMLVFLSGCFGDTLHFRDGKSVTGTWLGSDGTIIRFLVNNQVQEFPRAEIRQVVFGEGSSAPPASSATQAPTQPVRPAQAPQLEQTLAGVRIVGKSCERMGTQNVVCSLTAEALQKDGVIALGNGDLYLIDSKGIKKNPTNITIGGSSGAFNYCTWTNIAQNVPVTISLKFAGLDPDVTGIPRLKLAFYTGCGFGVFGATMGSVEFRNVPLTDSSNPVAEVAPSQNPIASSNVQNLEGFTIQLNRCSRQGTASILCSFSITNTRADRDVSLGNVYIVDSAGIQQQPSKESLGAPERGYRSAHAAYNTPIAGELTFGGVTPEVMRIAKLSMIFASGNTSFEVIYRNIPIPIEPGPASSSASSKPPSPAGNTVNPPRRIRVPDGKQ
ncbi:MAG TPA: hypothetical protein VN519_00605 [Bryobacteraceae bacterium]|nr:hypothetical protein [Bryobacteraceae bacterium]